MTSKRDIDPLNEAALLAPVVRPIFFARLDFELQPILLHTEIGPKDATTAVFGTETYLGVGAFGGFAGEIGESVGSDSKPVRLTLTGVDPTLISQSLTDRYFRRSAEIMVGLEDASGNLIADPEILLSGFMGHVDANLRENFGSLQLTCESRGTNLLGASDWRFTDEDLQREYEGDIFGEYIYRMADISLVWGGSKTSYPYGRPVQPGGGGRETRRLEP